nr:HTH domain-containing protein [Mycolicibacterium sphagni]
MSAARLSEEFEVSKRTIERDISSLQLAGVPIYADHGVSGGYSILRELVSAARRHPRISAAPHPAPRDHRRGLYRTRSCGAGRGSVAVAHAAARVTPLSP